MGCNGESRDVGVDACDGNICATNRKGSVTTSASLGEKIPYKRFTTVDDVSSGDKPHHEYPEDLMHLQC
jgi:hypothetical protein